MEALTEDGAFSVDVLMRADRIALEVGFPDALNPSMPSL